MVGTKATPNNAGSIHTAPPTMQIIEKPSSRAWQARCTEEIKVLVPLLDDEGAREIAAQLHFAWPEMEPKEAAEKFMRTPTSCR